MASSQRKTDRQRKEELEKLPWQGDDFADSPAVVAFDMGGVCGWSVLMVHPEALVDPQVKILGNVELWAHGQIQTHNTVAGEVAAVQECVKVIAGFAGCAVLMEDFILRMYSKGRELLAPVRLNAMLDYGLQTQLNVSNSYRQQPSEAKSAVTDERLKIWGFYQREGGLEHARDADRHAILFMRKAKDPRLGPARRAAMWPHLYGPGAPWYVPPAKGAAAPAAAGSGPMVPALQPTFKAPTRQRSSMRR